MKNSISEYEEFNGDIIFFCFRMEVPILWEICSKKSKLLVAADIHNLD